MAGNGNHPKNNVHSLSLVPKSPPPPSDGDGDGTVIRERLAKLEAAVDGLRHGHDILLGVMALGFGLVITILIAIGTYTLARIDSLPSEFAQTRVKTQ